MPPPKSSKHPSRKSSSVSYSRISPLSGSGTFRAVGFGEDQSRVVRCHDDAVRKCDVICHLLSRTIGGDQREDSGGELAAWEVEAGVAYVGVAPTVHDDVVPGALGEGAQVGTGHKRLVGLPAQQEPIARRDDEQAPIGCSSSLLSPIPPARLTPLLYGYGGRVRLSGFCCHAAGTY